MKKLILLFCLFVPLIVSSQLLKLGVNKTISNNEYLKNALGASIYLDIKIKQFELSVFADGFSSTNENSNCDTCFGADVFEVRRGTYGININHNTTLSEKFSFLKGVSFSYIHTTYGSYGRYNTAEGPSYHLNDMGIEGDVGIRYNHVFKLPISIDFFLRPTYTINLSMTPNIIQTSLSDNQFYLKPELSLVFLFDEIYIWSTKQQHEAN